MGACDLVIMIGVEVQCRMKEDNYHLSIHFVALEKNLTTHLLIYRFTNTPIHRFTDLLIH